MCMGFGCNAAGVISCLIIDSPRERLIAIITNNFVPCNGRFPTLIALAVIFIVGGAGGASPGGHLTVLTAIVLGVMIALAISRVLSQTVLGDSFVFSLELPPTANRKSADYCSLHSGPHSFVRAGHYRAARRGDHLDLCQYIQDHSILQHGANLLAPFALLGLDGFILMAFILGLPANEIVLPILIMSYMSRAR